MAAASSRSLPARLLGLFSSITLGIVLLSLLFVYSWLGSAGILYPTSFELLSWDSWTPITVRALPALEMTEFEWFHWWPFDLLVALICTNLVVATLRRIPFRPMNYGVWMIHTGIIVLALGSVWYFGTKFEGDAPVLRRQVRIEVPGAEPVRLPAVPGTRTTVDGAGGRYAFAVTSIDPAWSIRSGDDEGQRAYSVQVSVETPQRSFVRQMLAGYPEYTEDVIEVPGRVPPMVRAVKELGRPLVDESLVLDLEYAPQEHLYLANWISKSWALYVRERGQTEWSMRPVDGLPLYNDRVDALDAVWLDGSHPVAPLDVTVPPHEQGDPLPGAELRITSYLRYALMQKRGVAAGGQLDPAASVRLAFPNGFAETFALAAFDPYAATAADGVVALRWVGSAEERAALARPVEPLLTIRVPEAGVDLALPLGPDARTGAFTPIEGTDYAYRIESWIDAIEVAPGRPPISVASVTFRTPQSTFRRWVCDDARYTRDMAVDPHDDSRLAGAAADDGDVPGAHDPHAAAGLHGQTVLPTFEAIEARYRPGYEPAPLTVVAGPAPHELHVITYDDEGALVTREAPVGAELDFGHVAVTVERYTPGSEVRPYLVPPSRRHRDADEHNAMVRVHVPGAPRSVWVPYHHYAFRSAAEDLRRYSFRPAVVPLADGRVLELILSRERIPLPDRVVLDDFAIEAHVGGFSGRTSSIRNWTSRVRFAAPGGGWTEPRPVSVNAPIEHAGLWYFQSQWDPPGGPRHAGDVPSAGLNYTVLGVTNRHGVGVQLLGCCIAVLGMLYAFYAKPFIRQRLRGRARSEAGLPPRAQAGEPARAPEPLGAAPLTGGRR